MSDNEWGNIELPGVSDDKLLNPNLNKIISNKAKGNDPKFKEKMQVIYEEIGFSKKMARINKKKWKDPEFKAKQIEKKIINGAKPARKAQVSAQFKGVPKSATQRRKIGDATIAFNKTKEGKKVIAARAEAQRGIPRKKVTCPHCGKEGGEGIMLRWHFDNCKHK